MANISLKLPDSLDDKLAAAAASTGSTKSAVVREALEAYMSSATAKTELSFLDIAGDLLGTCEGPGDLSTNPKYMEGFGESPRRRKR